MQTQDRELFRPELLFQDGWRASQGREKNIINNPKVLAVDMDKPWIKLDLQSAGSSPNLTYTKISAPDAIRIL